VAAAALTGPGEMGAGAESRASKHAFVQPAPRRKFFLLRSASENHAPPEGKRDG
jgi:hypothetical protein